MPQAEAFLDQPNLVKKADKKGKGSAVASLAPATPDITGFTAAQPLAVAAGSAAASPAPRAGFKRIGTVASTTASAPESPSLGDGTKVALSLKRKAADEGTGTPTAKRR